MRRPIIGIAGNIEILSGEELPGLDRDYVNRDYSVSVLKAGGIPMIIPPVPRDCLPRILSSVDGVILSGGYDIAPDLYGEDPHRGIGYTMRSVDVFYMAIIEESLAASKPLLGICKGLQALNVALGGTLYQDIGKESSSTLCHLQSAPRQYPSHNVSIREGSMLSSIIGSTMMVNSFHHQAVKDLAAGLSVAATSSDGLVEAVEMEGHPVLAVQWHPEMMAAAGDEGMLKIFKHFIDACMNRF